MIYPHFVTQMSTFSAGILLRRLAGVPSLSGITHVVVDEVHERTVQVRVESVGRVWRRCGVHARGLRLARAHGAGEQVKCRSGLLPYQPLLLLPPSLIHCSHCSSPSLCCLKRPPPHPFTLSPLLHTPLPLLFLTPPSAPLYLSPSARLLMALLRELVASRRAASNSRAGPANTHTALTRCP